MTRLARALVLCLSLQAVGCDDLDLDDEQPSAERAPNGAVLDAAVPTGATAPRELTVDATDRDAAVWRFVDLDIDAQSLDSAAVPGWDIALQRSNIKLRSEGAEVLVSVLAGVGFDAVAQAPATGWDADPKPAGSARPEYLLASGATGWFDYDATDHTLTPRPLVYALRSDIGGYYKLAVLGWTNDAGTTGVYKLKVAKLAAPSSPITRRDAGVVVDVNTSASQPAYDAGTAGRR